MLQELTGRSVSLFDGELLRRRNTNYSYMMSLKNEHLLRNFELEAGRFTNREIDTNTMGGWESSTCQLRGHFLGHWLSAAALHYDATGDVEIKAKAAAIVHEVRLCQLDNGGKWCASIPEKYLYWIAQGRNIWAPQYTIHKLFMGLVDQYTLCGLEEALTVADDFADWFLDWSSKYSREEFDNILDYETSGMLEVWADLLHITGKDKYNTLLDRYYRGRLFDPLVRGEDVLTNMHANTTIPEILGCAKAYEVTGDQKWLDVVTAYWKCAVTDRGMFATGGQTQGEVWTPKKKLAARLGERNQEHCTVYNMMRLAEFLFLQTGDPQYLQYREYNLYNGIMAQAYYNFVGTEDHHTKTGLLTYFLPMRPGSRKSYAGAMDAFFCCHGTMVQANARLEEGIFYQKGKELYIGQYINSELNTTIDGKTVKVTIRQDTMNGLLQTSSENNVKQTVGHTAAAYANKPDFRKYQITICEGASALESVHVRIPDWISSDASVYLGDQLVAMTQDSSAFATVAGNFDDNIVITVLLPIAVQFITLPDAPDMGAFRYGGDVLAAITEEERIITLDPEDRDDPGKELEIYDERQWGSWLDHFKTKHQNPGLRFFPIREIGFDAYQMYFRVQ